VPAVTTALSACILAVSHHYGVQQAALERAIQTPEPATIGAAHIPQGWLSLLQEHGFDVQAIEQNPCESVAAAGWILRYTRNIEQDKERAIKGILPAKAQGWQPIIKTYARAAGIDPNLVNAVILQESGFNPTITSSAGAYGMMQLTQPTAQALGVNRYDPRQNLWGGIWYLSKLLRDYKGDLTLTLAAYNAGPGAVAKYRGIPPYAQTMQYVPSVMRRYEQFLVASQSQPVVASAKPILDR